jgi:hypothetical protein
MARVQVLLIEHGYSTTRHEREVIEAAGGEFIDAGWDDWQPAENMRWQLKRLGVQGRAGANHAP